MSKSTAPASIRSPTDARVFRPSADVAAATGAALPEPIGRGFHHSPVTNRDG
jgi:hypothetical protein